MTIKLKVIHGLCLSNILAIKFQCVCATTVQTEAKESKHSVNYQHCLLIGVVSLDKSIFLQGLQSFGLRLASYS